jgi:iron complex outermembrane receptor protein
MLRNSLDNRRLGRAFALSAIALLSCTALTAPAFAQNNASVNDTSTSSGDRGTPTATAADTATKPDDSGEIVVTGALGALPLKNVGSIFGFDKTIAETPRSASTVSSEQLERFGITQIYDLVTQSPGVFSSSYFGTGGALEIRGTPGEVYFRGMLRLENGGNYPTPIGAADRIDIVRGPAAPIYGPSKTGGYMNFVPKTARAENGTYAAETTGDLQADFGQWGYKVLKGSITGPGHIGDHAFGYSLYGEVEDSGSYYRNVSTRDALFSAAFDTDITSNLRTEFGGMYQDFKGQQNSGWNRLTQDLIDHGTYITGNPVVNLDANGDGKLSREEVYAANGGQGLTTFGSFGCGVFDFPASVGPTGYNPTCLKTSFPALAVQNSGGVNSTTHLSARDTLTGPDDKLNNIQKTAYFDLIWSGPHDLQIKNQVFYDATNNLNENAYGFSQFIKSYVLEDKIVISDKFQLPGVTIAAQASPSLRYTHFKFGDDYGAEFWNRPDISTGFVANTTRLLSTQCNCDYSDYIRGHYLDAGIAGLVDMTFDFGLDLLGGIRYDHVHAVSGGDKARYDPQSYSNNEDAAGNFISHASGNNGGVSWNASVSYKTPFGLIPYFTASHQVTIVEGEGAELEPSVVATGQFMAASKLLEAGVKGEFLDKRLYAAVAVYKQQRTDAAAESSLTNQVVKTKGVEAEVRWSVDRHLLVTANYTYIQVIDQSALAGGFFNYFGIGDLVNVPANQSYLFLGGSQIGLLNGLTKKTAERPGIPHNVASATATYAFDNGIAFNGDIQYVEHTFSGYTQQVELPAYFLLNLGASYKTGPWLFSVNIKNVNNARYFRAGGQDIFGADIALPELPRSWQASIKYKF